MNYNGISDSRINGNDDSGTGTIGGGEIETAANRDNPNHQNVSWEEEEDAHNVTMAMMRLLWWNKLA